jgi:GH15 family glucan-1,4-alpha-glucosidase
MHAPVPYGEIGHHGIVGDRRTAALIANDGTIDWLCWPDYDGPVTCGALLDSQKGGSCRFGPASPLIGTIDKESSTAVHTVVWKSASAEVVLDDVMAWPARDQQTAKGRQAVIRRLRCVRGRARCEVNFSPALNFAPVDVTARSSREVGFAAGTSSARLWCDRPLHASDHRATAEFELAAGEEAWAVLSLRDEEPWSAERAARVAAEARSYWDEWSKTLSYHGPHEAAVRRAGLLVHLLSYAPTGSLVAAPTTSLPERIGGDWNADYRCAWVRDASLSLTALAWLGNTHDCQHYLEWLSTLGSSTDAPLQPLYGIRGELKMVPDERTDLHGYRGSQPVRFGNHAYKQQQLDAFGYLAECMHEYLLQEGSWEPEFWELLKRCADHVCANWRSPGNSVWELSVKQHYLSAKVMSWFTLDRAARVAKRLGKDEQVRRWQSGADQIKADVLEHGWSERLRAFRQRYEADNLDAAALLVPITNLVPPDDPRARSTVERVADRLTINDFVFRFDPLETPGMQQDIPMAEFEGAFLPCTFWLAAAWAKQGKVDEAERILQSADALSPSLGLFAEGVDVRARKFLGNTPLLFSHVEYVRAVLALRDASR